MNISHIDRLKAQVDRLLHEASKPINGKSRSQLIAEATRLHLEAVALAGSSVAPAAKEG